MQISLNEYIERLQLNDPLDRTREIIESLNPIKDLHSSAVLHEMKRSDLALGAINSKWLDSIIPLAEFNTPGLLTASAALSDIDTYKVLGIGSLNEEFRKIHEKSLAYLNTTKSSALSLLDYGIPESTQRIMDSFDLHNKTSLLVNIIPPRLSELSQNVFSSFMAESAFSNIGADFAQLHEKTLTSIGLNSLESLTYPKIPTYLGEPAWLAEITAQANTISQILKKLENHYQLPLAAFDFAQNSLLAQMESLSQIDWQAFAEEYDFDSEETKHRLQGMSMSIQEQTTLQDITDTALSHINLFPPKAQEAVLTYVLIPFLQIIKWFIFKSIDSVPSVIISIAITTSLQQHLPTTTNSTSPQERSKHIQQAARDLVNSPELLKEFRFVIADELEVRFNPKSQSPTLGILSYGSPVQIIERRGAFTLINWIDANGESQLTGWVYSRYLRKFI